MDPAQSQGLYEEEAEMSELEQRVERQKLKSHWDSERKDVSSFWKVKRPRSRFSPRTCRRNTTLPIHCLKISFIA